MFNTGTQPQPNISGLMFDPATLNPYLNQQQNNLMPLGAGSSSGMPTNTGIGATYGQQPAGGGIGVGASGSSGGPTVGAGIPSGAGAMGGGSAGGGTVLGSILGMILDKDPYSAEESKLGEIPSELQKYLDPYMKMGLWAIPQLENQYGQLMNDPAAKMAQFGQSFQQSPGYDWQKQQALSAANAAAAAGGMTGSPAEQQELAKTTTGLANKDYYNYLNHVMNLYQQGLGGGMGMMQTGYGAAKSLAEDIADIMESEAGMEGASAQYGNDQLGGLFGSITSGIGSLASFL